MKPDSIILDIDGTLWNSTPIVAVAWNEILSKRTDVEANITAEKLQQLFGRPLPVIADMIFPHLEASDRYSLIDACCEREHEYIRDTKEHLLYPQVAETIRTLSKVYKVFIVSNCQSGYIELFMEKNQLADCITDFECPGYTGLGKGENIRLIIERNHLNAPVYVGDTAGDHEACKFAGIPFCFAAYGFGHTEAPDYTIQSFSELLTLF